MASIPVTPSSIADPHNADVRIAAAALFADAHAAAAAAASAAPVAPAVKAPVVPPSSGASPRGAPITERGGATARSNGKASGDVRLGDQRDRSHRSHDRPRKHDTRRPPQDEKAEARLSDMEIGVRAAPSSSLSAAAPLAAASAAVRAAVVVPVARKPRRDMRDDPALQKAYDAFDLSESQQLAALVDGGVRIDIVPGKRERSLEYAPIGEAFPNLAAIEAAMKLGVPIPYFRSTNLDEDDASRVCLTFAFDGTYGEFKKCAQPTEFSGQCFIIHASAAAIQAVADRDHGDVRGQSGFMSGLRAYVHEIVQTQVYNGLGVSFTYEIGRAHV